MAALTDEQAVVYVGKQGLSALSQLIGAVAEALDDGRVSGWEIPQLTFAGVQVATQIRGIAESLNDAGIDLYEVSRGLNQMAMQIQMPRAPARGLGGGGPDIGNLIGG